MWWIRIRAGPITILKGHGVYLWVEDVIHLRVLQRQISQWNFQYTQIRIPLRLYTTTWPQKKKKNIISF